MARSVRITLNRFQEVELDTVEAVDRAVRTVGFAVQEEAQANIRTNKSIDTGALLNSGYVETATGGEREKAVSNASRRAKGKVSMASPTPTPTKKGEAKVAFAVEHAVYIELGTERMNARPFLLPAVESVRDKVGGIVSEIIAEAINN